jgi:hypothetical protein
MELAVVHLDSSRPSFDDEDGDPRQDALPSVAAAIGWDGAALVSPIGSIRPPGRPRWRLLSLGERGWGRDGNQKLGEVEYKTPFWLPIGVTEDDQHLVTSSRPCRATDARDGSWSPASGVYIRSSSG